MATHRSDKRNWLVFGLAATLTFAVAGGVIYYLQPPSDGTLLGSPGIDMIAYGESAVSVDNDLSGTPATTSNDAVDRSAAGETATLVEQNETAVSAGIATTDEPGFASPQSSSQNPTASVQTAVAQNTESDNLIATADTSPGFSESFFLSGLNGSGGQTTRGSGPQLSGSNSGAPFPNPFFSPSAFMDPPSGVPAGGHPIAGNSPSNSPRTTAPQSTSGPSNISSPTPSGTPIVNPPGGSPSLGGPSLVESGGAPPTVGGPTSTMIIPGGSARNPITPTASTPDGTSILPISGAGCGTSNCGGHSWEFF